MSEKSTMWIREWKCVHVIFVRVITYHQDVPEVLNVHVNGSKKKSNFLGLSLSSSEKLIFEEENVLFNTFFLFQFIIFNCS